MSNSSRFGIDLLKGISPVGAYQRILIAQFAHTYDSKNLFITLANRFTSLAEHYYVSRDFESLKDASSVLMNLPLPEAGQIGLYYQSFIKCRIGQRDEAQAQLEGIVGSSLPAYKARALQTLGSFNYYQGRVDEALKLYSEASRVALSERGGNFLAGLMASLNICYAMSDLGDHQRSLSKLESLLPLVQHVAKEVPFYLYGYYNALAVEFAELGHTAAAQSAISVALSSPFASAYPEWRETREEIKQKRNTPDLSRCFIEHSLTESEVAPDSIANLTVDANTATETARATERKSVRVLAHVATVGQSFCQGTPTLPNASSAIIPGGLAQSILQRLVKSIQPRSPPTSLVYY